SRWSNHQTPSNGSAGISESRIESASSGSRSGRASRAVSAVEASGGEEAVTGFASWRSLASLRGTQELRYKITAQSRKKTAKTQRRKNNPQEDECQTRKHPAYHVDIC